jgi:hypothetical protein
MLIRRSALLLFLFASLPLFAQDSNRKTGITFSLGQPDSSIAVRRLLTPKWTALGTLSFAHGSSNGAITPVDTTSWSLGAGVRRVFISEELRPFVEVDAAVRHTTVPGCGHLNYPYVSAGGGVEYFVARRVSIEGSAGASYSQVSENCSVADSVGTVDYRFDSHSFSTFRSAISLTFYF